MHQAAGIDKTYLFIEKDGGSTIIQVRGILIQFIETDYFPISHIRWYGFYMIHYVMKKE